MSTLAPLTAVASRPANGLAPPAGRQEREERTREG
jgi:hypothetical protein